LHARQLGKSLRHADGDTKMMSSNSSRIDEVGNQDVARLNLRLEKHLLAYVAAAAAAGVSLLALAKPADAKVIYTKAHKVLSPNTSFDLDLNHDGTVDFVIGNKSHSTSYGSYDRVYVNPPAGNSFVGSFSGHIASALPAGSRVGSGDPFYSMRGSRSPGGNMAVAGYRLENGSHAGGPWLNGKNRYLGLRFTIQGQAHYGWARLSLKSKPGRDHLILTALLTGYAYETVANKSIITGKTRGPDVITLEPASLGHLARGASAMKAWRQKEQ